MKTNTILACLLLLAHTISSATAVTVEIPLSYDGNGNLLEDGTYTYEYDGWNRLRQVFEKNSGDLLSEYWYDHNGERYMKVVHSQDGSNETTHYVGDFVRVFNSSGTYDINYIRDDKGLLLARIDPEGSKKYYHPDHLGNTRLITDDNGDVVERIDYLPFGATLNGSDRYTFTGHEGDGETDLVYMKARYYSPVLRQFTQPDTIIQDVYNPQNLNRYSYVLNNPVVYMDPTGHVYYKGVATYGTDMLRSVSTMQKGVGMVATAAIPLVGQVEGPVVEGAGVLFILDGMFHFGTSSALTALSIIAEEDDPGIDELSAQIRHPPALFATPILSMAGVDKEKSLEYTEWSNDAVDYVEAFGPLKGSIEKVSPVDGMIGISDSISDETKGEILKALHHGDINHLVNIFKQDNSKKLDGDKK